MEIGQVMPPENSSTGEGAYYAYWTEPSGDVQAVFWAEPPLPTEVPFLPVPPELLSDMSQRPSAYRVTADRTAFELIPDRYLVYAEPDGNFVSRYEVPPGSGPTQPNSIMVPREVYDNWTMYRATVDRTSARPILTDEQLVAKYKPVVAAHMETRAQAAGFGTLAEAIRWKDRAGHYYQQHGQEWDDYERAVRDYCTLARLRLEPEMNAFKAEIDAAIPAPQPLPYPEPPAQG